MVSVDAIEDVQVLLGLDEEGLTEAADYQWGTEPCSRSDEFEKVNAGENNESYDDDNCGD